MATALPSVPVQGVIDNSREGGYLAHQYYIILSRPAGALEPVFEYLQPHLAYHEKLEADGIEIAAGPIWSADGKSWEGAGMIVVEAASVAEADALAAADPMHTSGARTYEISPWMVNHGNPMPFGARGNS